MYIDGSIRKYVEDASAGTPTPGGGSVASLAGALGLSMACMAANFTVGKKKFKDVEQRVRECLDSCLRARDELLRLMDDDMRAYAAVSDAYAMPKDTPGQKAARAEAIQRALVTAMDAPLRAVRACREAMRAVSELADIANPNLISDVGVAALLTEAALRAAKMNVEINLKYLKDESVVSKTRSEVEEAAREVRERARATVKKVAKAIGGTP